MSGSGLPTGGHRGQSCPLREGSSGVKFNTRAGESGLSLETRQPRPQERMTSWWPMGTFASNQRSMMDMTMTLSSAEGQGQRLVPDGPRPAIFGLCFPGESGRTVSSFLFSIFVFRLPRRELLDANITVLIFPVIPLHPGARGPVLLVSSNLQGSFSPPSCLASPFSVLFSSTWLLPLSACPEKHRFKNFVCPMALEGRRYKPNPPCSLPWQVDGGGGVMAWGMGMGVGMWTQVLILQR